MAAPDWLMVVDLQPAFSHPSSPWFMPGLDAVSRRIARLVPVFGERVLFTRFIPPEEPERSWRHYYDRWPFALEPGSAWLWDVDAPWQDRPSIASHRFSKWLPEARARIGEATTVLCGVSTDCCVLMTALAAVDDGARLRVVTDACAAKTPAAHDGALSIMASRAPQLTLVTLEQELARQGRAAA